MTLPIPAPASLQGFGQLPPSGVHSAASAARVHAPEELRARRELPTEVVTPVRHMPDQTRERSVEAEAVSFEGGPKTNPEMNGEVGQLLSAISPFLWGLEDASAYMDRLAQGGEPMAVTHARTLKLLAKLLTQLKNRVDDLGL